MFGKPLYRLTQGPTFRLGELGETDEKPSLTKPSNRVGSRYRSRHHRYRRNYFNLYCLTSTTGRYMFLDLSTQVVSSATLQHRGRYDAIDQAKTYLGT